MSFLKIAEENPIPVAVGVVTLILIVVARSSGGSSVALANNSQQLATAQNTQIATINANLASALGSQSVDRFKISEASAIARTTIAADILKDSLQSNTRLSMDNNLTAVKYYQTATAASINRQQIESDANLKRLAINSAVQTNSDNLATQMQTNASDNNTKLSALAQTIAYQLSPAMMYHQELMARNIGANQLEIVRAQNKADNTAADAAARSSKTKDNQSWIGAILNGASKIFSFF